MITNVDRDVLQEYDINRMNEAIESNFMARKVYRYKMNEESTLPNKKARVDYLIQYFERIMSTAKNPEHRKNALDMYKKLTI